MPTWFANLVIIGDGLILPAAFAAALPLYSDWVRKMRGSRIIQVVALVIIVCAVGADGIDRLGILWPSPSQVAEGKQKAETLAATQARIIDDLHAQIARQVTGSIVAADGTPQHPYTDPRLCPPGSIIFANNTASNGGSMVDMPRGTKLCYVSNETHDMRGPDVNVR